MATTKATEQSKALTVPNINKMTVPDYIKQNDRRGAENITTKDIRLPALRLAQAMSPETKRADSKYIEDLREGMFFDSMSREIYGEGPLNFLVINMLGHRHIEFAPQSEGGGVIDFNVPDFLPNGDPEPRTVFTEIERDGKLVRVKPKATKFYDYLVYLLLDDGRRLAMTASLKGTQLAKAIWLNSQINASKMASFAIQYSAEAVPEKRGNNNYYGWKLLAAGYPPEEVYLEAEALYTLMADKKIEVVDTDADDAAAAGAAPIADENIPF